MNFTVRTGGGAVMLALLLATAGCGPISEGGLDEQREAHFLSGKARLQALDFNGAIEAFEKTLEVNPRNASAHFELGLLYEHDRAKDFAAAIYHFERFLRLRPDSPHRDNVTQHVAACKRELAATVTLAPVTQSLQNEFAKLAAENAQLKKQNEQFKELLEQRAVAAAIAAPPALPPPVLPQAATPAVGATRNVPAPPVLNPTPAPAANPPPSPRTRTHTVQAGDTPTSIARRYGVKVEALLAANRNVDPRKMKVGQKLVIPAP